MDGINPCSNANSSGVGTINKVSSSSGGSTSAAGLFRALKLLNCGFISGLLQAGLFNPWDRALYLSVRYERPFYDPINFRQPMAGVFQTLFQRAFSAGLYFPLEQLFKEKLIRFAVSHKHELSLQHQKYSPMYVNFLAGSLAGAINGIIMNPFAAVKVLQY